ncbi:MAG: ABC transporter permease subunit [Candidatus Bathyarchaeota archaeon]|jgi:ABC-type Na+ efflux pump permease subunit|nr:ABC transporter permease subunit [Candidatus Bathyarchaeota archaeon A05DMB-5]MDH7607648.1 ABC transporter permease subunit [Candidatus Bathyarchaeota archaeon]
MRLWKAWIVAKKDISVFRKNKYILYSLIAMPLVLALPIPATIFYLSPSQIPLEVLTPIMNGMLSFFILIPAILPTIIASYSFVGEKMEKSLEPLLATPTTDNELLVGKCLAAFLPSIIATYIGSAGFVILVGIETYNRFGVILFPNWEWAVIMAFAAPLACILSVEMNVIISSRVNDVRAAQQLGGIAVLPIILIYFLAQLGIAEINVFYMLVVSSILFVADLALYYISRKVFQREEILTKWK